ncbi:MAG: hypothetical protein FWG17_02920 [Desulfovibrionaceae bacterium]|nr:hypothetical protein [Desulfovibrionaceae bacterium]
MFVYRTIPDGPYTLFTVGHYSPDGKWNPESDHSTMDEAADRVHYLNGGSKPRRYIPPPPPPHADCGRD